jgi:hypothetical protein
MPALTRSGHSSWLRRRRSFQILPSDSFVRFFRQILPFRFFRQILSHPFLSGLGSGILISATFPENDLGWTSISTPDRLNVYPRTLRDDPSAHRLLVDLTIRGVRFEEPRRQIKQHPLPRTEATSGSVVSQIQSFRQHNLLKNTAVTDPEQTRDGIDFAG